MSGQLHCFVGPTLPVAEVRRVLPDAQIHPPIAHGDLLRLGPSPGDTVAIIDGYFYERAPIRHKEILGCIDAGVTVAGAASIGALRAAELAPFGMRGVGAIYRMYRLGLIDADDEVAVLHASDELGYRCMTEALVNIRASCAEARRRTFVSAPDARLVITTAAKMPFHRRSWPEIEEAMTPMVGERHATYLSNVCDGERVDLKHQDARRLLVSLLRDPTLTRSADVRSPGALARTRFVEEWPHWEIDRMSTPYGPIRDIHILSIVQALAPEYPSRHLRVLLECYLAGSADPDGHEPLEWEEIEAALGTGGRDQAWAEARHLSRADVSAHLSRKARVSRLVRGTAVSDDVPIDELEVAASRSARDRGLFAGGLIPNEVESVWLDRVERETLGVAARAARVIARSHRASGALPLRTAALQEVKLSSDVSALSWAIERAWAYNRAVLARDPSHDVDRLSVRAVEAFYLTRWGRGAEPGIGMTERGFTDSEDLSRRAGPFMLAARFAHPEVDGT